MATDIGTANVGAGLFTPQMWHRFALVVNGSNGTSLQAKAFLNGASIGSTSNVFDRVNASDALALGSAFYLFSDNSGDTAPTLVNSAVLFDNPLFDEDIAALGGDTADGIPSDFQVSALELVTTRHRAPRASITWARKPCR